MTAIGGIFADFKLIKTRSCAQIVIEVPIETADHALAALGGLPQPAKERWVGLVALTDKPHQEAVPERPGMKEFLAGDPFDAAPTISRPEENEHRAFHDLPPSAQAGIKCVDLDFQAWLTRTKVKDRGLEGTPFNGADTAVFVRKFCGVSSRAELNTNEHSKARWIELLKQYEDDRLGRR